MQPKKILWVSRLGFPCSYHYVTKSMWEGLKTTPHIFQLYDFTFLTLTIAPRQDQVQAFLREFGLDPSKFYYSHVDFDMSTPEDEHFETICLAGWLSIIEVIKQVNPKLVIILEDTEPAKALGDRINQAVEKGEIAKTFKTMAYVPVDCHNVESIIKKLNYDYYMCPTKYGASEFRKIRDDVFDLPHSVRQPGALSIADESKVLEIISVNTNHIRKRWDLVFQSYLLFAQKYQNPCRLTVKAMVLKGVTSKACLIPNTVFDLVAEYEKWSKVIVAPNADIRFLSTEIPIEELDELYRQSDIGLYMTSGEGFGLTPLEGGSFGMAQIVPDNSSFRELFPYYSYRVTTHEVPLYLSRECIQDESNFYLCLFKSYTYDKEGFEEKVDNKIARIPSLVISPTQTNLNFDGRFIPVIQRFLTLRECEDYIQKEKLPPRFQVLINLSADFLKRQKWDRYPHSLKTEGRYELFSKYENIKVRIGNGVPSCGIPFPEDAADKLLRLATNLKERERAGEICRHYASKFTTEEINKKFLNILSRIIPVLDPIVILSYERSGTHFLINSLVENFGYDPEWIDIDNLTTFPPGTPFQFNKIYKCHHCAKNIANYNFQGCRLIKLTRNKNDNLRSYQKYLYLIPWNEGPKIKPEVRPVDTNEGKEIPEDIKSLNISLDDIDNDDKEREISGDLKSSEEIFSETKTSGAQERYQTQMDITQSQRYDNYHNSFNSAPPNLIIPIKYEDMINDFDNIMRMLTPLRRFIKPTKVDTTIL